MISEFVESMSLFNARVQICAWIPTRVWIPKRILMMIDRLESIKQCEYSKFFLSSKIFPFFLCQNWQNTFSRYRNELYPFSQWHLMHNTLLHIPYCFHDMFPKTLCWISTIVVNISFTHVNTVELNRTSIKYLCDISKLCISQILSLMHNLFSLKNSNFMFLFTLWSFAIWV